MKSVYYPPEIFSQNAHIKSLLQYKQMYDKSIDYTENFWKEMASNFYWEVPPEPPICSYNFNLEAGPIYIKWFENAKTNICYNALDYNIATKDIGEKIAFHWEGNDGDESKSITYEELLTEVCKFANVLKKFNVKRGDRVIIYMPMIIEVMIAILACCRIGVVHSVVFAGFSKDSLLERILNAKGVLLITANGTFRGEKLINLCDIVDQVFSNCKDLLIPCIVVNNLKINYEVSGTKINWHSWNELMNNSSSICEPEWMDAEESLFILYTSGSTGKPKGILHTVGGYMVYAGITQKYVFDIKNEDVYWCTADVGWITGHTYTLYGPLLNGITSVIFEGVPYYPHPGRWWEIIDKYNVSKFYTAPTAIRMLMGLGNEYVYKFSRKSLKVLGTVGEPINPEAWHWYYKVVGSSCCPVVDTFWQTETGGHVITPLPGATPLKPGSAALPFFGIKPHILKEDGQEANIGEEGYLVFSHPWPGMLRGIFEQHKRFEEVYFSKFKGYYFCGDSAHYDDDGYFWITGRIDDMVNVSGHLLSTAEIENVLTEHHSVAEAAAVSRLHPVKGECLYCFITPKKDVEWNDLLVAELKLIGCTTNNFVLIDIFSVRKKVGPFAVPDYMQYASALPKTRSGKIMRRLLRKIARNECDFGDISTLAEPNIINSLFNDLHPL